MKHRRRWLFLVSLGLMALLLAAPAVSAAREDAQQQADGAKSPSREPAARPATAPAAEAQKKNDQDEQDDQKKKEEPAALDPSFNTIEDILALDGPVDSLWAAAATPPCAVTWRPLAAEPPPPATP